MSSADRQRDLRPPYLRIADELRRLITTRRIPVGETLPSYNEISRTHRVAMSTAQKAVGVLRGEGLVASANGVATYVISTRPHAHDHRDTARALAELHRRLDTIEEAVRDLQDFTGRSR